MKSKSLILMVVSLFFGLIAAVGISRVMGRNSNADTNPKTKLVPVVVATEFLDHDTQLSEKNCKIENWPAEIVPEDSASSLEQLRLKAVTVRVNKGVPISMKDVIDITQISTLMIPPGFCLQGVKVSEEDVLNGLIQPGDHVDLIGFFEKQNSQGEREMRITTFMKNVKVFSVDGVTRRESGPRKSEGSKGDKILGLLVTMKQAEQVVLVQRVATLRVVLRDGSDDRSHDQALSTSGDVDFDAMSLFEEAKSYLSQMTNKPKVETEPEAVAEDPNKPAFVAMYQLGESVVYFPFDKNGNLIPPQPKKEGSLEEAASPNELKPTDSTPSGSKELEEDQYPGK
jgi:pilus assembly protein CpaB